ncbi:MAG: Uncharacterized MFS-type transporter, partial [uncultured Solirubrobacteraceae bacterium]
GQRRAAGHPRRARHRAGRTAVDRRGLPAHRRGPAHARRVARRPPRPAADVQRRPGRLRAHLAAVRPGSEPRDAGRRPRTAGRGGRAAGALEPGHHQRRLPARGARRRDRQLVGVDGRRLRPRAAGRRRAHRPRLLALDLRHQRAPGGGLPMAGPVGAARDGQWLPARGRPARRHPRRPRPGRAGVCAHRAAGRGLERATRVGAAGRGRAVRRRVPGLGGEDAATDAAARDLRQPQLRRRQPGHAGHLRRSGRRHLPGHHLPAAGRGLERDGRGLLAGAHHGGDVAALQALRAALGPHRAASADGLRSAGGGRRDALDGRRRRQRRLPTRPAGRGPALRSRAVGHGGAVDQHRARSGRSGARRRGQRRQQRHRPGGRPAGHRRDRRRRRRSLHPRARHARGRAGTDASRAGRAGGAARAAPGRGLPGRAEVAAGGARGVGDRLPVGHHRRCAADDRGRVDLAGRGRQPAGGRPPQSRQLARRRAAPGRM